jgi:hypothetical protein
MSSSKVAFLKELSNSMMKMVGYSQPLPPLYWVGHHKPTFSYRNWLSIYCIGYAHSFCILSSFSITPRSNWGAGGVEMMVIFTRGYLTLWRSVLIIVWLGYGLITNPINIILHYSRWLKSTKVFMWVHNPFIGEDSPSHKLCINTYLMSHL